MITRHSVQLDDCELVYREIGDGPPLVLLSGALISTGDAWIGSGISHRDFLPNLAKHFRVIAPDTRGAGASAWSQPEVSFDMLTNDVLQIIDILQLDRPIVAGFSEGGGTALHLARRYPDRLRAVISHGSVDYLFEPDDDFAGVRSWYGGAPDATHADPEHTERTFRSHPDTADIFDRFQRDVDDGQGEGAWRGYLQQLFSRHVVSFGMDVETMREIDLPTLIMCGDRDFFYPVEQAVEAWRALPNGELAVLPNTGHAITPAAVEAMIDFGLRHSAG